MRRIDPGSIVAPQIVVLNPRGFALVEVLIAAALLVTLAVGVSRIVAAGVREVHASRLRAVATLVGAAKLEELRSLTAGDAVSGADCLDVTGQPIGTQEPLPALAVYTRRWTVRSVPSDSDVVALQVDVSTRDGTLMARLTTVRAAR